MTRKEAQKVLELFRPADRESNDPAMRDALALTRTDAELRAWFEQHQRTEQAVRDKFRAIPVPETLKQRLLEQNKVVRPQFGWRTPLWLKLAACFVVLLGVLAFAYYAVEQGQPRFAEFQSRMVRSALREYKMELLTGDMAQLRHWMEARRAPADFTVPKGLAQLPLTGGAVLRWHDHPVSMACFDRGNKQMVFLFVMDKAALTDPPNAPQAEKVKKLATVSWTEGENTYLLAGPGDAESLRKYLGGS
jgi:hypothetical protein